MKNPFSNAPEGFPDTFAGYPLFYAIGGDGKPVGKPKLVYNGNSFDSPKEVAAYKKAVEARDEALDNLAEFVRTDGKFEFDQLSNEDWCYYGNHPEVWGLVNGKASQFNEKLEYVFYNLQASFNEAAYKGLFRPS